MSKSMGRLGACHTVDFGTYCPLPGWSLLRPRRPVEEREEAGKGGNMQQTSAHPLTIMFDDERVYEQDKTGW
jgi:hypothetical protein